MATDDKKKALKEKVQSETRELEEIDITICRNLDQVEFEIPITKEKV